MNHETMSQFQPLLSTQLPASLDSQVLKTASHLIPCIGSPEECRSACNTMCITSDPPNGWMVVPLMLGWTAKNLPLGLAVYPTYLSGTIIDPFGGLSQQHTHHCTMIQSWMKCCGFDIWDCQMVLDVNTVDGLEIRQKQLRPRENLAFCHRFQVLQLVHDFFASTVCLQMYSIGWLMISWIFFKAPIWTEEFTEISPKKGWNFNHLGVLSLSGIKVDHPREKNMIPNISW